MELERRSSEEENDAVSWGDVATGCCKHTQAEWLNVALHSFIILFFLYFFLFSLQLLGTGAKIIGGEFSVQFSRPAETNSLNSGCTAGALMGDIENPVAGLCIGILATVLLQSSSTTTSIVVGLVPTVIDVKLAIFVIMGANIGTSVTNTIVSMGHLGDGDELERAFAGATVHDMFNFLSVAVLLPLEVATGLLFTLTEAMTPDEVADDEKWTGPVKAIVAPLANKVLIASKMIKKVADGSRTCDDYYPTTCTVDTGGEFGNETVPTDVVNYDNCHTGLIACDKKSGGERTQRAELKKILQHSTQLLTPPKFANKCHVAQHRVPNVLPEQRYSVPGRGIRIGRFDHFRAFLVHLPDWPGQDPVKLAERSFREGDNQGNGCPRSRCHGLGSYSHNFGPV